MGKLFEELKRRNVLRVAIAYLAVSWLLIQVADTIFPAYGLPDSALTILITILAIGFIPALVLAWAFELTAEGVKRDQDVDRSTPASVAAGKNLDRLIIVVLVLALGYFAVDKFVLDPARDVELVEEATLQGRTQAMVESYGEKSIAVLPFVNMSSDPEQEYFSDGMAEELLNLLSKVRELRVISRSSAFAFKGQNIEIATIAQRLNVSHVLEGSVRKSGNRIRITTQLIDARTDTHLWSEIYDRELDDVFAIQDEISAHVVEQLKITILGDLPHAKQIDPETYNLYLRAQHIVHGGKWDKLSLSLAEKLLNEALEIEPEYIPALDALGVVYSAYPNDVYPSEDHRWQLIRDLAARISAAEPGGVTDLVKRAWIAWQYDDNLAKAAPLYERALALDPGNLKTLRNVSSFLTDIGYIEEAITTAKYVALRDPTCAYCLQILSYSYRTAGQYDKAIEILQNALEWSPDRHAIHWALGSVLLQAGRPAEALAAFEKERSRDLSRFARLFAIHDLGRMEEFEQDFAEWRSNNPDNAESHARIYAWTGNNDLALEWLEKYVVQDGPEALRNLTSGGFYVNLESDFRFDELLLRHGQHPDQREKIQFDFTPPE